MSFNSLLIANRGEIALRVLRTARRMGLRVVAVYSDADAGAMHVRAADQAVHIGGSAPRDSYLNIPALLAAAAHSGAQAVHPGYGFLAENAAFAQAVIDAGLTWIGPPPAAMRAMADKAAAKRLLEAAGVPCLPGYNGADQSPPLLEKEAERIGYPLMIKATAGGGGRGMRLVYRAAEFLPALQIAQSEAQAAFGIGEVLLEKAVIAPRHVVVQVFADTHGDVVHLGERDCSVQRRHQKIIEEAPSPAVNVGLRRQMGAMAVAAARAVDYVGAGTVECLLDAQGNFHFMEMNTRLQVEHPVTEALTGYDLVEWQLRVAQGEALPETDQAAILARYEAGGHAIEVRLCAEDPARQFLPQTGALLASGLPAGVRVDHAIEAGAQVSPYYDSMIAKIIAHAPSRAQAAAQLVAALRGTTLLGVRTNQAFLQAALAHEEFAGGGATTAFVERHGEAILGGLPRLPAAVAALLAYAVRAAADGHDPAHVALPLAWPAQVRLLQDEAAVTADVLALGGSRYRVTVPDGEQELDLAAWREGAASITGPQGHLHLAWAAAGERVYAGWEGAQAVLEDRSLQAGVAADAAAHKLLRAPMAGRIVSVQVVAGQQVEKGAVLLALEAMKMEHPALATMSGRVKTVHVAVGMQVVAGAPLVELEAAGGK